MSLLGRLDTKVVLLRTQPPAEVDDKYGDANEAELRPLSDRVTKGAFHSPRGHSTDQGAGEYSMQKMVFFCHVRTDIQIGDVLVVVGGVNPGHTRWLVEGPPYRPANKHTECLVTPFQGEVPIDDA
jgi:hypothetical protein